MPEDDEDLPQPLGEGVLTIYDNTDGDIGAGIWADARLSVYDYVIGMDVDYKQGELDIDLRLLWASLFLGGRTGKMRKETDEYFRRQEAAISSAS